MDTTKVYHKHKRKHLMVNTYRFGLGSPFVFLRCVLDLKRRCSESREMLRPCAHKTLQWHRFWKHDSFSSENKAETAAGTRMYSGALQRSSVLSLWKFREWLYLPVYSCMFIYPPILWTAAAASGILKCAENGRVLALQAARPPTATLFFIIHMKNDLNVSQLS